MNQHLQDAISRGLPDGARVLVVDIRRQQLQVCAEQRPLRAYRVSTGQAGTGQAADSRCTPTGWHEVAERIGMKTALGQPFISREPAGAPLPQTAWRSPDADDRILTRILRLRGLEPGHNAGPGIDSYLRWIYIHGTNHEQLLGTPASRGCIRMANRDIAELADILADTPTWCWIG